MLPPNNLNIKTKFQALKPKDSTESKVELFIKYMWCTDMDFYNECLSQEFKDNLNDLFSDFSLKDLKKIKSVTDSMGPRFFFQEFMSELNSENLPKIKRVFKICWI